MKFKFYHIHDKYIAYLYSAERKVQHNKHQHRPYVGIVLQINDIDYYVPLESPKPNHINIRNGGPVLKLDNGNLGLMGFNNMIPVPDSALVPFNFNELDDEKYKNLLINQLRYCNNNRDLILRRAQSTYNKVVYKKVPMYTKVCCDFSKLEKMCPKYNPNHKRRK